MPFFNDVPLLPDDPILGIPIAFAADPRPDKVNLSVGSYKTADGSPLVLSAVKKAEQQLLQKNLNKEYLPIEGDGEFIQNGLQLLFGNESPLLQTGHYFAAQTVGGASALRIGGEFLAKLISKTIFLSQPSWSNHKQIYERAGLNVGSYPYIDPKTGLLDFHGMCEAISNMPPGSIMLVHASCHNPTGIDPTPTQWQELSTLIKKQQLIPFFDIAYQGFGEDLDADVQSIRLFINDGHELLSAYSFSKNFGLYGERIGFLTIACANDEAKTKVGSQIKSLIRGNYSNPPLHGERIVATILKSHNLTSEWKQELTNMRERVKEMRKALVAALHVQQKNGQNFNFINHQKGLFAFTGLTSDQVQYLREEKAIYMPLNGRINIASLNTQNLNHVADGISSAIQGK